MPSDFFNNKKELDNKEVMLDLKKIPGIDPKDPLLTRLNLLFLYAYSTVDDAKLYNLRTLLNSIWQLRIFLKDLVEQPHPLIILIIDSIRMRGRWANASISYLNKLYGNKDIPIESRTNVLSSIQNAFKDPKDAHKGLYKTLKHLDLIIKFFYPEYVAEPIKIPDTLQSQLDGKSKASKDKGKVKEVEAEVVESHGDTVCVKGMVKNPRTGKLIKANGALAKALKKQGILK